MKISIFTFIAFLSTSVLAAPTSPSNVWKGKNEWWNWKKNKNVCDNEKRFPYEFTSTYHVVATPDQVVNGTTQTGGLTGVKGFYELYLNSDDNLMCHYIRLDNFRGDYQSPAKTATHLHQAVRGASGPPRIAFPNPIYIEGKNERYSIGCQKGPFSTGLNGSDGVDTGSGFYVRQIEDNPSAFFVDVHSSQAVPGAVRGQIA
ncbi:Hypothetical protein R9X50_00095300 [Acrodontium crateriforme]|uniref:CHRD domain-containing protein n=1 Tax=Acrodontium crateriforme TaxID=150365 RepID=A0AAQ3R9M2_9PEZI|nr:Hypothetical protein R9X50_00095300 [Acrodontium crateriforme]